MVVHAGIVPDRVLNEQKEFDMMMIRNVVAEEDQASLKALIHENEGDAWAAVWNKQCQDKVASGESAPRISISATMRSACFKRMSTPLVLTQAAVMGRSSRLSY